MPGGAPTGNKNAIKGSPWRDAINRALAKRDEREKGRALANIAEKLLAAAEIGDVAALKELGDRLDGKAAQAVILAGDQDNPVQQKMTVEFVGVNAAVSGTQAEDVARPDPDSV